MQLYVTEIVLQRLNQKMLAKYGNMHPLPSDCRALSADIFAQTSKMVSETTLKRFIGFARKTYNFSMFTLEAIAEYSGYDSWDAFYQETSKQTMPEKTKKGHWHNLQETTRQQSLHTYHAVHNSSGITFSKTIERNAFTTYIKKFRKSTKSIAPVIAPAGYGKSIALLHTCFNLWLKEGADFSADACLYINAFQLASLTNFKSMLSEWLSQYVNTEGKVEVGDGSRNRNNQFILIIDGFDDRCISAEKTKIIFGNLIDFIQLGGNTDWIKVIIAMRPSIWKKFKNSFSSPAFISQHLYIDDTYPSQHHINYTLRFTPDEVTTLASRFGLTNQVIEECLGGELTDFLNYPAFFEIFVNRYLPLLDNCSQQVIIHRVVQSFITQYGVYEECRSVNVIEHIIHRRLTSDSPHIIETGINNTDSSEINCYKHLFDKNIIVEEEENCSGAFPFYKIKFTSPYIEGYFLAYSALVQNGFVVNDDLFAFISSHVALNKIKIALLKWLIVQIFTSKDIEKVAYLFKTKMLDEQEKLALFEFMTELSEETNGHKLFLSKIEHEYNLIESYLEHTMFRHHILQTEYYILKLLSLATNPVHKKTILCLLFIKSVFAFKFADATIYLKTYRQIDIPGHKDVYLLQDEILHAYLDFAQFGITADNEMLVRKFLQCAEFYDNENHISVLLSYILLSHHLFFSEDFKQLMVLVTTSENRTLLNKGGVDDFVNSSMAAFQLIASTQTVKDITILKASVNNLPVLARPNIIINSLGYLAKAMFYAKAEDYSQAKYFAKMVIDIAGTRKLFEFINCAYKILLDCYRKEGAVISAQGMEQELQKIKHARRSVTVDITKKYDHLLKSSVAV